MADFMKQLQRNEYCNLPFHRAGFLDNVVSRSPFSSETRGMASWSLRSSNSKNQKERDIMLMDVFD